MDAATGTVLFSKNGNKQFYPASITKLMTALLVAENCSLDDKVTFSATATTNLEAGAVSINMTAGDVDDCAPVSYALLSNQPMKWEMPLRGTCGWQQCQICGDDERQGSGPGVYQYTFYKSSRPQ